MNLRVCLCSDPDSRMMFLPEHHDEGCPERYPTRAKRPEPFAGLPEHLHGFAGSDYPWPGFGVGEPPPVTSVRKSDVVEIQKHLERIEQKLDETIKALKSGAIGAWGNEK